MYSENKNITFSRYRGKNDTREGIVQYSFSIIVINK